MQHFKRRLQNVPIVFTAFFSLCSLNLLAAPPEPAAIDIIRQVDAKLSGKTSQGRYEITIVKPRVKRTLMIDSWADTDRDRSFLRIIEPKKDRGVTFLKWEQNLWQYIPKIGKEIKIEGSLLQDSWMGSDFTNDDLVRATSIVDDYEHTFLAPSAKEVFTIQMKPKPGAPVVWSRVVMDVRKSDVMPLQQKFYDHKDRLSRVMDFSEFETMGGRYIPTYMVVRTIKGDREISQTAMRFINVLFDTPIPESIFSKSNLRK
jgi:hypothetical protein